MDMPLHPSCRLIARHACGLIAIEKSEGVLSHPNRRGDEAYSLLNAAYDYEEEAYGDGGVKWYLVNRLDAPTSGVILLADDPESARLAKEAFAGHGVEKTYLAAVRGMPHRPRDDWRDRLQVIRKRGSLRTVTRLGTPNAFCQMQLLEKAPGVPARSILSLRPATGRTHQLRVQCASRHLPIIGDTTYGNFSFNREFKRHTGVDRLFLHCSRTALKIRVAGNPVDFSAESPRPDTFAIALQ